MSKQHQNAIRALANHPQIALARIRPERQTGIATGHKALDDVLPEGGWPRQSITELLVAQTGLGEFGLLLPALSGLNRKGLWIALVAPPWIPCPQALAAAGMDFERLQIVHTKDSQSALWAMHQFLQSGAFSAVLGWPRRLSGQALRRLQLAAENGSCAAFLTRPLDSQAQHSTAALRILLERRADQLDLTLLKCRGRLYRRQLSLAFFYWHSGFVFIYPAGHCR